MEFQSFYIQHTQGEVNHEDGPVHQPSSLDDLLGVSRTSMDVDTAAPCSAPVYRGELVGYRGLVMRRPGHPHQPRPQRETELNAYTRVQQLSNDTDPPMWWEQHRQERVCQFCVS